MKKENRVEMKKRCRWLAEQVRGYSSYGIASKVYELINNGTIKAGEYLPTTRDLAEQLGVVPSVVSTAWGLLRDKQMISGTTRSRIRVIGPSNLGPIRTPAHAQNMIDLAWLDIDPALVPGLVKAVLYSLRQKELNQYRSVPIIPMLEEQVRAQWPYPAEAFLATNGSYDGLTSLFISLFLTGNAIAVAIPSATLILDILGQLKIGIVPVICDQEGPVLSSLETALLNDRVAAFIYQPRVDSVTGVSISPLRMEEMSNVVRDNNIIVIEHDTIDALSLQPRISLGQYYPERTCLVTSYSTCYGPDLRLAVMSGTRDLMQKVHRFREFTGTWSSRILQGTLAWLMQDSKTQKQIESANAVYRQRQQALINALSNRKINTDNIYKQDSLSIWLKVPSEKYMAATLAEQGIIVLPGSYCGEMEEQYIRVTTCIIQQEQIAMIADAIAAAYHTCPSF